MNLEISNSKRKGKRPCLQSDDDDDDEKEEEEEEQPRKKKKRLALISVISEALMMDPLQKVLERLVQRVVTSAVDNAISKFFSPNGTGRCSTEHDKVPDQRNLQLHFTSTLSLPIYTDGKIKSEQGAAINVVLRDATTGDVVKSGPESSVKLVIVVLQGDFNKESHEDWTQAEFESHLVKEREGKRPILIGDLQVTLEEGEGTLGNLRITDNSSWVRSGKFRIGLKVASGCCVGIRIREAKTNAFAVKDRRGELYKKHYPPALDDEVWRLEKIGKDGPFRKSLKEAGIKTVEDFLRLVVRDSERLRNILGSGMTQKNWEVLVQHARTCALNGKHYVYYSNDSRNFGVIFNDIYELKGLIADGYHPVDSLCSDWKASMDDLVKKAYNDWTHITEYGGNAILKFKQNTTEFQRTPHDTSNQQLSMPCSSIPIITKRPTMQGGLPPGGIGSNENSLAGFQELKSNFNLQFDGTSSSLQNQPIGTFNQTQILSNDSIFELAPSSSHSPISGFHNGFVSNLPISVTSDGENFFLDNRMAGVDSNDMLQGHHDFSGDPSSYLDVTNNGYMYSSGTSPQQNFSQDEGQMCLSRKADPRWLKLVAVIMWGIRIKNKVQKKAAERLAPVFLL